MNGINRVSIDATLSTLFRELCMSFRLISFAPGIVIDPKDAKLLIFLVKGEYGDRSLMNDYVHYRLLTLGEATFIEHIDTKIPPDHCLQSHRALGYAIRYNHIPFREIAFDHGETADEYVRSADGLLESVIEQLLTYKEPDLR